MYNLLLLFFPRSFSWKRWWGPSPKILLFYFSPLIGSEENPGPTNLILRKNQKTIRNPQTKKQLLLTKELRYKQDRWGCPMNTIIVTLDSPLTPPAPPCSNTCAKVDKVAFLRLLASAIYIILRICRVLFKCRHKPIFLLNVSKYFYCTGKTPGSFVWVDKFLIYQYYRENALVVIFILWFFDWFIFRQSSVIFFSCNFIILSCCKTSDFVFYIRQILKVWIWNLVADLFFCRLQLILTSIPNIFFYLRYLFLK